MTEPGDVAVTDGLLDYSGAWSPTGQVDPAQAVAQVGTPAVSNSRSTSNHGPRSHGAPDCAARSRIASSLHHPDDDIEYLVTALVGFSLAKAARGAVPLGLRNEETGTRAWSARHLGIIPGSILRMYFVETPEGEARLPRQMFNQRSLTCKRQLSLFSARR
jgi:hypothetical protein